MVETTEVTPEAAQAELRALAEGYEELNRRLSELAGRLPTSPMEGLMLLGELDADVATEIRRVVDCLLGDHLHSVVEEIRTLAEYRPESALAHAEKGEMSERERLVELLTCCAKVPGEVVKVRHRDFTEFGRARLDREIKRAISSEDPLLMDVGLALRKMVEAHAIMERVKERLARYTTSQP